MPGRLDFVGRGGLVLQRDAHGLVQRHGAFFRRLVVQSGRFPRGSRRNIVSRQTMAARSTRLCKLLTDYYLSARQVSEPTESALREAMTPADHKQALCWHDPARAGTDLQYVMSLWLLA